MPRNNVALSCEKPSLEKTMHIEFGHFGPRTTSGPKSQCSKPTIRLVFAYLQGLRTHLNESQITCHHPGYTMPVGHVKGSSTASVPRPTEAWTCDAVGGSPDSQPSRDVPRRVWGDIRLVFTGPWLIQFHPSPTATSSRKPVRYPALTHPSTHPSTIRSSICGPYRTDRQKITK